MGKGVNKKFRLIEYVFLILIVFTFLTVAGKYSYKDLYESYKSYNESRRQQTIEIERQAYTCPPGTTTIIVVGGKICRTEVSDSTYKTIFDTYPFKSNGKEQIYEFFSEGDIESANQILANNIPLERYGYTKVSDPMSWTEDPLGDRYWRFLFYGFRPVQHLFFAFDQTNEKKYLKKAEEITLSFIDHGTDKPHAWDDFHAVSFRTMYLIKTWWMLRENNLLTYEVNEKILKTLEAHGDFLADPNHYDKGYNHGLNEAAALYLVAVNFPDFSQAPKWLELSKNRLNDSLITVVDTDGVLIENSPYYHFYTLEKYWELYNFAQKQNFPISDIFNERLQEMISYATYILQPNKEIPLLGASLKRKISYSGIYKDISQSFPELKYVLTNGKEGNKPTKLNITYPESGEVIMRSGWGVGEEFENQTQAIFDFGPYRTLHSDFDALSFSLYANGINLMPDAGLYAYEESDYKNYFHGTASHNTVVVDDLDQTKGTAVRGDFLETKDYVSQSAEHELYKGVSHMRSGTLIGKRYLLILDKLTSNEEHTYKQLFHLFPGARITTSGTSVKVFASSKDGEEEVMNIFQMAPDNISLDTIIGQTSPPRGWCAEEYAKAIPCYSLEYIQKFQNVTYATLIEIGKHDTRLLYSYDGKSIIINDSSQVINIDVTDIEGSYGRVAISNNSPVEIEKSSLNILKPENWEVTEKTKKYGQLIFESDSISFSTNTSGNPFYANIPVQIDLSNKNLLIKMRVVNRYDVNKLDILLSTNNWEGYIRSNLKDSYRKEYDGEWLTISLGKGLQRETGGQWRQYGTGFDWSNINAIRIVLGTEIQKTATLQLADIALIPSQKEGEVIIVFDDGFESILPAVTLMNDYGFKGNIAVIADKVTGNERGYLSLKQLKQIKEELGWDLINHSGHHVSALEAYVKYNDIDGFTEDLLAGAKFLIDNDLNTTPNWYIYPHGATNKAIKDIVGKYYAFARTTINQPEAYPFGDPLGVKTISADGMESSGTKVFVPVSELESAIIDAKTYKLPLFITFHRISSLPGDKPGYELGEFKKLIDFIKKENLKVKTLREFDSDNGIEQKSLIFIENQPPQLSVEIYIKSVSIFARIQNIIINKWLFFRTIGDKVTQGLNFL